MSELFDPVLAAGAVRDEVSDAAWLRALLDVEAALAQAEADAGLFPREHADRITEVCREGYFDVAEIGAKAVGIGNPAAPLVREITTKVGGDAARYVHFGATSQDVMDSAAMLVAKRALPALLEDVEAAAEHAARLAREHAGTVQAGRTLLQQAIPVTFGLTAAGWLSGLDAAARRLRGVRLAAQLGGATGTLASLGERGPQVLAAFSRRLELDEPALPWHTERSRIAELAGALGELSGIVGGASRTITLLAQTEVAEVAEVAEGSGGSSTMPHKRNPVAAIAAQAAAQQAPGLVSTLLAAMTQEHQRAAGSWHAEWRPITELFRSTGSAISWLCTSFERLCVDAARMRKNLDATGGAILSERVTTELAKDTGRLAAHDAVTECTKRALAGDGELADLLAEDPLVGKHLSREKIGQLLDPADYLGSARPFVERALAAHAQRKEAS
ncbi:3-carboxy-cis,cis-muconate cycloisomerase [Amycolatopsis acidiphila]|uniref:3-carboxy-cis,cis-muconate cycloisomerase n=1 Tax=Amycolatopsis acidiphila TaxID=715473 RepID=A0A558AHB6_9PSEU|nr:3-carboxy-cis,cis-muconate cycloisomerase [Amycolatopsis acidiphila]TVT23611.1 3-carboxy-cis,cis-muconate cycloisomerase [Amycolatopsis acidiphila]UIJ58597.1 3-carboxy-cis,cis-muconate cycloisomerase [Amycolatopsis acidiphila]GHG76579.1 3-carboxy-cis,cis-muconate cycloisomerase [Amycolatopsis acidiphila]